MEPVLSDSTDKRRMLHVLLLYRQKARTLLCVNLGVLLFYLTQAIMESFDPDQIVQKYEDPRLREQEHGNLQNANEMKEVC